VLTYVLRFLRPPGRGFRVVEGVGHTPGRLRWYGPPGALAVRVDGEGVERFAQAQGVAPDQVRGMLELLREVVGGRQRLPAFDESGVLDALLLEGAPVHGAAAVSVFVNIYTRTGEVTMVFVPGSPGSPAAPLLPLFLSAVLGRAAGLRTCARCGAFFVPGRRLSLCSRCRPSGLRDLPAKKRTALRRWLDRLRRRNMDLQSLEGRKLLRQAIADAYRLPVEDFLARYDRDKKKPGRPRKR
jgi:hypothetical protein